MAYSSDVCSPRFSPICRLRWDQRPGLARPGPAEEKERDTDDKGEADGVGLHFVKLRPEPVTGDNMRSLVQVWMPTQ